MHYQVTVRYGATRVRYHLDRVEGENLAEAMRTAAERLPAEVIEAGELVEIRPAIDPEEREYLDGQSGGPSGASGAPGASGDALPSDETSRG